jgi:hypothetical protein
MSRKPNIIIKMGAPRWEVQVRVGNEYVSFDMRKMTGKQKSEFHREFMNAFRESRK